MDENKINDAMRRCLEACNGQANKMTAALQCLQQLRREGLWTDLEVEQVRSGLVTVLVAMERKPPASNTLIGHYRALGSA